MSDYALIQDNTIVEVVGTLPDVWNDGQRDWDLRPMTDTELAAIGWLPVVSVAKPPDTDTTTHDHSVELVAGKPTDTWTSRPKTELEITEATAATNQTEIVTESYDGVDKMIAVVEALNVITAMTNSEINANPAAVIKDLAREVKTVARQVNHGARIVSGRLDSTENRATMTALGIVASAYVKPAAVAATKWVNHVAIAAPRNTLTTHTVNPASGTVAAGTNFTPTAGRFLLLVIQGSVTSTAPSWTLEASAVNATGLYAYTRTAAGSDTVTSTHNAADYPVIFHWFEFNAGTTWHADVSGTSVGFAAANPNLTGLTGTNLVMAAKATTETSTTTPCTATWTAPATEILDYGAVKAGTDGYFLTIGYQESYASASYQPTCTVSPGHGSGAEALTWALKPV